MFLSFSLNKTHFTPYFFACQVKKPAPLNIRCALSFRWFSGGFSGGFRPPEAALHPLRGKRHFRWPFVPVQDAPVFRWFG
jgi:hypothetical protein